MHGIFKALTKEQVVSISDLQKSPSIYLKTITRIMKGKTTLGFFFPLKEIERMLGPNKEESIWLKSPSAEEYRAAYERGDIIND